MRNSKGETGATATAGAGVPRTERRSARGLALVLLLSALGLANAQSYSIDWFTIDGGGGTSTGGNYSLSGTIGQPDAGAMSGGTFTLVGGFWAAGDENADSDGDGMPDSYELANGLDPFNPADGSWDGDGDGFSNYQEYLAGTNPQDGSDYLRIVEIVEGEGEVLIRFIAAPGKTYQVRRCPVLDDPGAWAPVEGGIAGTGTIVTVSDPDAGDASCWFYKIILEQ